MSIITASDSESRMNSRRAERLPRVRVDADLPHAGGRAPTGAVVVPREVRVDAAHPRQPDWIGPRHGRIGGGVEQVAVLDVGGDESEPPVVVAKRGRVDAARGTGTGRQTQLLRPVQGVAELGPGHQVAAGSQEAPLESIPPSL